MPRSCNAMQYKTAKHKLEGVGKTQAGHGDSRLSPEGAPSGGENISERRFAQGGQRENIKPLWYQATEVEG